MSRPMGSSGAETSFFTSAMGGKDCSTGPRPGLSELGKDRKLMLKQGPIAEDDRFDDSAQAPDRLAGEQQPCGERAGAAALLEPDEARSPGRGQGYGQGVQEPDVEGREDRGHREGGACEPVRRQVAVERRPGLAGARAADRGQGEDREAPLREDPPQMQPQRIEPAAGRAAPLAAAFEEPRKLAE